MNIHIEHILKKGEGISVEFKRAEKEMPKSLFETICAFLNRSGGIILLGVSDDGTVLGVQEDVAEKLKKNCTKDCTKEILLLIKNNPTVTTMELAEKLNVARRTIANYINILKKENKITRIDGRKTGKWLIFD